MNILAPLPRQERLYLLVIVEEPTRHIIVLWGIKKLPFSYANRTALDGHIVAFSHDIVAGNTSPTIAIGNEWWNLEDHPVPSQLTAASKINKIRPEDTGIPQSVTVTETACIPRACIAPLVLAHPLLTAPLPVTSCRLHPTLGKSHSLELGRPTVATHSMAQGVPVPSLTGSKLPSPPRVV